MRKGTQFFRFGATRQERGAKHVNPGDLLEAVNVRQTPKAGVYGKRKGLARTAQTFVGGSLSGAPSTLVPGSGSESLMRDTGDQLWSRNSGTNTWNYRGTHRRPWPETTVVQSNLYTLPQPFSCMVGSNIWIFGLKTSLYEFTILDAATGTVVTPKVSVTATNIVHASAAYDGTYVWVFWVDNGANGTVRCHKITAATPTVAPVATNYYTMPSAPTDVSTVALQQVQARYFSAAGKVFVVACGGSLAGGTYRRSCMHSVLDPATGLAVAAGGQAATTSYVFASAAAGAYGYSMGALYILDGQDGSGTYWYYVFVHGNNAGPVVEGRRIKVTASTFATFTTLLFLNSVPTVGFVANCSGYVDNAGNGKQYVLVTRWDNFAVPASNQAASVLYHIDNTTVTSSIASYNYTFSWVASGFATVGGRWYVVTAYDDYRNYPTVMAETSSLQRTYHLREFVPGAAAASSTLNIAGQFDPGNGPAIWHRNTGVLAPGSATPIVTCTPPLHASGTDILGALAKQSGVTGYEDVALLRVQTAKVYGDETFAMGRAFSPGNLPVTWSAISSAHETAPLLGPEWLTASGGTGTDFSIAAVVYAIYDNDGTVWRSFPFVLDATIGHGATLTFPAPVFSLSGTSVCAEVYIGINGTPKLQQVFPPSPGAFLTFTTPLVAAMVNGEILYTTGGALEQTWPPPCQAIAQWNNRLFAAQKNKLWVSKELEAGFSPIFNEAQCSTWNDEDGDITGLCPVDWNYLGMFSESRIAVISGQGPDGIGSGNYIPKTLQTRSGVAAGEMVAQGPYGAYFQDESTGILQVLMGDLRILEAAGGAYDYTSAAIASAAWHEEESLMVFVAPSTNSMIVVDYLHPQETAPFGQVYYWTFAAALGPKLVTRDATGLLVINGSGDVFRQAAQWVDDKSGGTDTYQMKLASAELQLANIQGEFSISSVQALMSMRGASGVTLSVYPGYASATLADARVHTVSVDLPAPTNSGDTESVSTRPANCSRIQSFRLAVVEKAGVTTQSFEFEAFGVEYTATGRLLRPAETRVI